MNNEDEEWQLFLRETEAKHQKSLPDISLQMTIGCLIGSILGPLLLLALLCVDAILEPDAPAGGPLGYLFLFIMAVPTGGVVTAILSPFIVRWARKLRERRAK